jgi:hypothetical protein
MIRPAIQSERQFEAREEGDAKPDELAARKQKESAQQADADIIRMLTQPVQCVHSAPSSAGAAAQTYCVPPLGVAPGSFTSRWAISTSS